MAGLLHGAAVGLVAGAAAAAIVFVAPAAAPFLLVAGIIGLATAAVDGYYLFTDPCADSKDKHYFAGAAVGGLLGGKVGYKAGGRFAHRAAGGEGGLGRIFRGHRAGRGFSGVFDPDSGSVVMRPSSYADPIPAGHVSARGGHATLSFGMGNNPNNLGFTAFLQRDGSLGVRWLSRSVNGPNPNFPGAEVPAAMQGSVLQAITAATGRTAFSLE